MTELQPGHFIGSISYVTEETAPANVVAIEPTRYVSWPKTKLKDFMNKNPELHSALKSTLAIDLTRWLQATLGSWCPPKCHENRSCVTNDGGERLCAGGRVRGLLRVEP